MYTEENEKSIDIRGILLKSIIVITIILLLIWIVSELFSTDNKKEETNKEPSYEQVYHDNVELIKEATIKYFTTDKLPGSENEMVNITLKELISKEYISVVTDANGNTCDADNSFASITNKGENQFSVIVRLVCSKQNQAIEYTMYQNEKECGNLLCKEAPSNDNKEEENKEASKEEENKPANGGGNTTPTITTEYQYQKTTTTTAGWTNWSEWKTDSTNQITSITCADNDLNCTKQIESKVELTTVGTMNIPYSQTYQALTKVGEMNVYGCTGSTYEKVDGIIYQYTGGTFKLEETIKTNTPPKDTYNTRYKFIGLDDTACGINCYDNKEKYIYEKYVYSGNITTSTMSTSCNRSIITTPVYLTKSKTVSATRLENVNSYVRLYREKTRETAKTYTEYKWSTYNNKNLLNSGWSYTGKTR